MVVELSHLRKVFMCWEEEKTKKSSKLENNVLETTVSKN
jgi:hypothetical protein